MARCAVMALDWREGSVEDRESLESHPGSVHDILGSRITQPVDSVWKWSNQRLPVRFPFEMVGCRIRRVGGGGEFVRRVLDS